MLIGQQFATTAQRNPGQTAIHYLGKDLNYGDMRKKNRPAELSLSEGMRPQSSDRDLGEQLPGCAPLVLRFQQYPSDHHPDQPQGPLEEAGAWLRNRAPPTWPSAPI